MHLLQMLSLQLLRSNMIRSKSKLVKKQKQLHQNIRMKQVKHIHRMPMTVNQLSHLKKEKKRLIRMAKPKSLTNRLKLSKLEIKIFL
ncbi:hypothetical protein HMPREF2829_08480 [Aerococcus sp. HMSC072A12]|nr:hypothetical protein HMPREF2829_08480 [Aerococcus sp. HMSC072A12]